MTALGRRQEVRQHPDSNTSSASPRTSPPPPDGSFRG